MNTKKHANITKTKVRQRSLSVQSGPVIQKLRKQHNLTQQHLANRLNISRSTVGNWEAGLRTPSADHYRALADLFHVDIDSLY